MHDEREHLFSDDESLRKAERPRGRAVPPAPEPDRRAILMRANVDEARAWVAARGGELVGDDRTVLISLHEARAIDPSIPRWAVAESRQWLRRNHPDSSVVADPRRAHARDNRIGGPI